MSGATAAAGAVQVVGGIALAPLLARPRPALEGAAAGPARADAAAALPRAAPAVGQERRRPSRARRSSTGSRRRSSRPRVAAAVLLVPVAGARAELGRRPRRARARRPARAGALRGRRRGLGRRQRLLADGREPRPDALGLRRGDARALARRRGARRRHDRPRAASSPAPPATSVWTSPALALGAVAFALVVVAETGRQPVDNPDTHLELTMIHEGPLLEYAGRDLAYLQWAAAARHWLVLVLAAQIFLPHPAAPGGSSRVLPARARRALRRARARARRSSRRCGSCSCRGCSPSARVAALLGIVAWLVETP